MQNKLIFSQLFKINLIPGGTVKNLQIMSLLGIRSHLPSISYSLEEFRVQVEMLYRLFLTVDLS